MRFPLIVYKDDGSDYGAFFPDFPGCVSYGDDLEDALEMGAGLLESYISIALMEDLDLPELEMRNIRDEETGAFSVLVSVDVEPEDDVPVRTTAQAAEMLGVSTGRVRQMIRAGILERRKEGRDNLITLESIERRLDNPRHSGRPRKEDGDR